MLNGCLYYIHVRISIRCLFCNLLSVSDFFFVAAVVFITFVYCILFHIKQMRLHYFLHLFLFKFKCLCYRNLLQQISLAFAVKIDSYKKIECRLNGFPFLFLLQKNVHIENNEKRYTHSNDDQRWKLPYKNIQQQRQEFINISISFNKSTFTSIIMIISHNEWEQLHLSSLIREHFAVILSFLAMKQ